MLDTAHIDEVTRAALATRLKSIEGQARGIQRMLEEGRACQAILDQLTALRAASHAVMMQALERFARQCLAEQSPEQVMTHFVEAVSKLTR
jgi:DNA-binding FrmR family transcriptional regulator